MDGRIAIITGGNGAVGMGIATRLLQESFPITVILVCRNIERGKQAMEELTKTCFEDSPQGKLNAIQYLKVMQCDLSDPKSVSNFCSAFKSKYDHLNYLYLNAGLMPVSGSNIILGIRNILTRPSYVARTGGDIFVQPIGVVTANGYGHVFAANVLGHFQMIMELEDRLEVPDFSIISWCSSTTAIREFFDYNDYQALRNDHPYESSKRLGELILAAEHDRLRRKNIYTVVTSPGNVYSGLSLGVSVAPILLLIALWIMRLFGASGINITGYNAATSAFWLATLDKSNASKLNPRILYHSEINLVSKKYVREIELDIKDEDIAKTRALLSEIKKSLQ